MPEHADLLAILRDELTAAARALGLAEHQVRDLVASFLDRVRRRAGGAGYWVRRRRDSLGQCAAIAEAFDGKNHDELCRRFHLSRRTLGRRLARWRARNFV